MPMVPAADRAHRGNPAAGGAPVHSHGGGVAGAREADRHEVGGLVGSKGQNFGRNNESRERTCWIGEAGRLLARGEKPTGDRKSTRLNSGHDQISYAVFCLKKKKNHEPVLLSLSDPTALR